MFAGFDVDATDRARGYFRGVMPSSPSIALLKDGELVYMLERHHIEVRSADQIATELRSAFDRFCSKAGEPQVQPQSARKLESATSERSESPGTHFLKIQIVKADLRSALLQAGQE